MLAVQLLVFVVAAALTWAAGIVLSRTTDSLDRRWKLGDALGGVVLLAVAGSLPEVAITVSAAASGHLDLAAGNLIGGIATQTMVLVVCDLFAARPLTYLVGSLVAVLEGLLVVVLVALVMLGALLPGSEAIGGVVSPASVAIVVVWLAGVWIISRVQREPKWEVVMTGARPGRHRRRTVVENTPTPFEGKSTALVAGLFGLACAVTLGAGVALEITGNALANRAGINGVVFGATILALASALPEISSGIEAVRLGDHRLAVGDIFGGNAFQVCLFLLADLIAVKPVLPTAGNLNSWLAGLSILLTCVYALGIVVRAEHPRRLGPDSLVAVAAYVIGIVGLTRL